ncbi:unnamed protein product [Trichogramma brassicae]|uniref:Uncharacterized protein n=1 Tax=Trichogramma brassicae TaxID=86971 RepID=A0A6H5IGS2_9HYME|nr:unnamed protein product [Trichogramma brassicae]
MSLLRLRVSSLILLISLVECLVDPERVGLCCALCDDDGCSSPISGGGGDANQHQRNCRVYTENETDSCDVDLSLRHHNHGWTRSQLLRVVDLVQAEVPRGPDRAVMLTWLEPEDDGSEESAAAGLAKSRFVEFYGCRRIDRVMSMRYDDLEDMMGFLGEQESSEYAISLADYGCASSYQQLQALFGATFDFERSCRNYCESSLCCSWRTWRSSAARCSAITRICDFPGGRKITTDQQPDDRWALFWVDNMTDPVLRQRRFSFNNCAWTSDVLFEPDRKEADIAIDDLFHTKRYPKVSVSLEPASCGNVQCDVTVYKRSARLSIKTKGLKLEKLPRDDL